MIPLTGDLKSTETRKGEDPTQDSRGPPWKAEVRDRRSSTENLTLDRMAIFMADLRHRDIDFHILPIPGRRLMDSSSAKKLHRPATAGRMTGNAQVERRTKAGQKSGSGRTLAHLD